MDILLGWSEFDKAYIALLDPTAPETAHDLKITLSNNESIGFVLVSSSLSHDSWLQLDPDATTNGILTVLDDHDSVIYTLPEFRDIVPGTPLRLGRNGEDVVLNGLTIVDAALVDRSLTITRP